MATTRKTGTTARSRAAAPPPASPAVALKVAAAKPAAPAPAPVEKLRKKGFLDEVVIASGVRKRDAKPAVEAALELLGKALEEGRQVTLPPLGNLRVANAKETGRGTVLTLKLRRTTGGSGEASETVAEEADAG